jgi:hypothetical protein
VFWPLSLAAEVRYSLAGNRRREEMMKRPALISLALVVLAASTMLGCSSVKRELRQAKEAGTIEALDAFLAKHPDGPLAQEAKDAKEELVFNRAKKSNTVAAYQDFLKRFPGGKLEGAAQTAIDELHFGEAQAMGTIEAYDRYLSLHPKGANAAKASQTLERLLPGGLYATVEVKSTEPDHCTVHAMVTVLHKTGALPADPPPSVEPGTMVCGPEVGKAAVELEKVEPRDANHTLVYVKIWSAAGWGECRGTCTARFVAVGQEHVITAVYQ